MKRLFRLAPLPVIVLGLFASFFINLSLSSPAEALICPAGQVEVFRGVPQYRQCATPTNRKPNEVPCAERGDDRKTILVDGECFMPAYETGSTCFNWTETLVRDPISNGSWGDRERCLGTSESQAALDYCAPYGTGWVAVPKDGEFICMASVKYEDQIGKILQPPQSGAPGIPGGGTTTPGQTNPDGTPDDGEPGVPIECNVESIGWMVCPIMNRMADMLDGAFSFISQTFLVIDKETFNSDTEGHWAVFRDIANALFGLAFMVIVASQISNIGISNYGIKKLLPKLIMVAILVNLSFILCKIAVDVSNIAGVTANNIFEGQLTATVLPDLENAPPGEPNKVAGILTLTVLGATAATGLYVAFPFLMVTLLTGLLSILATVILLSVRKVLILLLVVISPLALACMLLPNTEKLFNKWKSLFIAMLLLFPTIGLIWGASSAAAKIITSNANVGWFEQILALAIMCIPLFATIPVVKGSMNAFGKLGGKLGAMGGKVNEGAKKWYGGTRAGKRDEYMKQGRATRRSLSQAGQGKGPLGGYHRWSNSRSKFGKELAASGLHAADEQETKEVNERMALIGKAAVDGDDVGNATRALESATASGDVIGARAASQILAKGTGQAGKKALGESLAKMQENGTLKSGSAVNSGLKKEINRAGIKGDDAVLDKFSVSKAGEDKIEDIRKNPSVYSNLAIPALLNQRSDDIGWARQSEGLDQDTASRILQSEAGQQLDQARYIEVERAAMGDTSDEKLTPEEWQVKKQQLMDSERPRRAE